MLSIVVRIKERETRLDGVSAFRNKAAHKSVKLALKMM